MEAPGEQVENDIRNLNAGDREGRTKVRRLRCSLSKPARPRRPSASASVSRAPAPAVACCVDPFPLVRLWVAGDVCHRGAAPPGPSRQGGAGIGVCPSLSTGRRGAYSVRGVSGWRGKGREFQERCVLVPGLVAVPSWAAWSGSGAVWVPPRHQGCFVVNNAFLREGDTVGRRAGERQTINVVTTFLVAGSKSRKGQG